MRGRRLQRLVVLRIHILHKVINVSVNALVRLKMTFSSPTNHTNTRREFVIITASISLSASFLRSRGLGVAFSVNRSSRASSLYSRRDHRTRSTGVVKGVSRSIHMSPALSNVDGNDGKKKKRVILCNRNDLRVNDNLTLKEALTFCSESGELCELVPTYIFDPRWFLSDDAFDRSDQKRREKRYAERVV